MSVVSKPSNESMANAPATPLDNVITGLHDFAGKWRLARQILQINGDEFVFEGQATFTWQKTRLIYRESGTVMAPNGKKLQAERTYFWQPGENNQVDVFFEDNRYFHSFSGAALHAEHLCGNDHYKVQYDFNQWPLWESSWQVTGPRKDYRMISRYQPA